MSADYSRIHRLLKILTLVQSESGWTPRRLAQECGHGQRTIFRDLQMLRAAGIPVFHDTESNGYSVRPDFFMRPVELTLDESLALMALAKHLGGEGQIPFTNAAAKALIKIRSQLPAEIRGRLDELDGHVAIRLPHTGAQEDGGDVYERVRQAIGSRRAIQCQYESAGDKGGAAETFLFKPYTLFFSQRAWYVIGHHEARGETRCLKLNRFTMVRPTERPYFIPDDFSMESHLGNAWRMIRGKNSYELVIRFDKEFADSIAETSWHKTQSVQWQEDGSLLFRCTVDGLDEVTWWVLSMGHHCVVLQPQELAQRVKELATKVVAAYETVGVPQGDAVRSRATSNRRG